MFIRKNIDNLPPETLCRVISLLDFNSRVRLGSVCKTLHAAVVAILWAAPSLLKFPKHSPTKLNSLSSSTPFLNTLLNRYGHNVRSLSIPDLCESFLDLHALSLSLSLSGLFALDLSHCAPYTVGDKQVLSFLRNCPQLFSLSLDDCLNVSDLSLMAISHHENKNYFHTVSLRRCIEITDFGITTIVKALPRLSTLNLRCIPSLSEDSVLSIAKNCQNIRNLDIADLDGTTDLTLAAIAASCTKLKSLDISECVFLTVEGLINFSELRIPFLPFQNLRMHMLGHALSDTSLMSLLPLKHTGKILSSPKDLDLEISHASLSKKFLTHMSENYKNSFRNLTLSEISISNEISDDIENIFSQLFSSQIHLTSLNLNGSPYLVNDNICCVIAKSMPLLENLDFSGCTLITDVGIIEIANNLHKLNEVSLKGVTELGDAGVRAFVKSQKKIQNNKRGLQVFNIGLCENVTDLGVISLASLFLGEGLTTLKISGCFKITDDCLDALRGAISGNLMDTDDNTRICDISDPNYTRKNVHSAAGEALQLLCLSGCFNISDRSISQLIPLLPHLESLNMYACPSITDSTITILATNCPRLASLVISKCNVGDRSAFALAAGCRRLHTLYIAHLLPTNGQVGLGDDAVRAILKGCRQLKLMDVSRSDVLTDRAFTSVGQVPMQVLIVKACPLLRISGLLEFVKTARRVQSVDVTGCIGINSNDREKLKNVIDEREFDEM
ncbi:hypothetical protein HK096_006582 [Nowakowskiella sp. JEL0078]|nr:hypothetical protein HK096_006582 [Nowakowskiella sp. JEL0078]